MEPFDGLDGRKQAPRWKYWFPYTGLYSAVMDDSFNDPDTLRTSFIYHAATISVTWPVISSYIMGLAERF